MIEHLAASNDGVYVWIVKEGKLYRGKHQSVAGHNSVHWSEVSTPATTFDKAGDEMDADRLPLLEIDFGVRSFGGMHIAVCATCRKPVIAALKFSFVTECEHCAVPR
jgi:hypothetical protein